MAGEEYSRWMDIELLSILSADTIIDVGVFQGTPELYDCFRHAKFVLVDPIKNGEARLTSRPDNYVFVPKAVGSKPGSVTLKAMGAKTTILERTALTAMEIRDTYEVEVTTLDAILEQHSEGRTGIKIDTEGYELEVLAGLTKPVDFIICEASIRKRFVDGYRFSELVIALKDKGYEFFNILDPLERRPLVYDCLFLKADHPVFE